MCLRHRAADRGDRPQAQKPTIPCVRGRSRAQWPRRKSGMGKYGGMKAETLEENNSFTEIAHRKMTSYVV